MKNYIYLILVLGSIFMFRPALAQRQNTPQPGDNYIDPGLNKFIGTYIWTSGSDTVKIVLKKENIQFPGDNYRGDNIIGFYLYKKGNNIVTSSIEHQNTNWIAKKTTILAGMDSDNILVLTGSLRDLNLGKSVHVLLTLSSNHSSIVLKMEEVPGLRHGVRPETFNTFTLPNNITLTRFVPLID